jgi:GNAT superfamily N-acetyltransferase
MADIEYSLRDGEGLELTDDLWRKLVKHHAEKSRYFSEAISRRTTEQRNRELRDRYRRDDIRIDLAHDKATGKQVGYCVTTIDDNQEGEIQSIFVEDEYRRKGIGGTMMKKAIGWMDRRSVTRKIIAVAFGNEEVFPFYSRYSFYPRATILAYLDRGE